MTTGYEVGMYRDIHRIAVALEQIAKLLESGTPQAPVQAGTSHGVHEEPREEGK